jgi:hypothetical protein
VIWNKANKTDPAAEESALEWSVSAMQDVTARLPWCDAEDRPRAFAVIGEAVWWVTIVDATMVRHHLEAYDDLLASYSLTERRLIEGTLGGLRFVRNRMGVDVNRVDFVEPVASRHGAKERITEWIWRSVPEPAFTSLSPQGRDWEKSRYQAYEDHLAGQTIGEVFGRAARFLNLAAAKAISSADSALAAG